VEFKYQLAGRRSAMRPGSGDIAAFGQHDPQVLGRLRQLELLPRRPVTRHRPRQQFGVAAGQPVTLRPHHRMRQGICSFHRRICSTVSRSSSDAASRAACTRGV
jgi:hypothetical protein